MAGNEKIEVELGVRSYEIRIETGLLQRSGEILAGLLKGRRCLVVTDRNVGPSYGPRLAKGLQFAGFDGSLVELPPGESAKNLETVRFLYDRCLDAKLDRESCLVALGGGVIGDLTGFAAATFFRGIAFAQIPTTLLAMVDAAIGGKTGVDHPKAKNAIGAFHQPKAVLSDPLTLNTLPDRELKAGLAEVIKYGIIADQSLFEFLEKNMDRLLVREGEPLVEVIARCAALKAGIVSADEREETGARAVLNFGHTFAHALETVTNYSAYLHGEAVAIGMAMAAELSVARKSLSPGERDRIVALIAKAGLPVKLKPTDPPAEDLYSAMFKDKKLAAGKLRLVVAAGLGRVEVVSDASEEAVKQALSSAAG
jgi:3-dehydroquinate synthase